MFFMLESSIAIIERLLLSNFLKYENLNLMVNNYEFRSRSLMGDPLNNAMIITTILAFVVTTKKLNSFYKIAFFLLGFFSLLSFNARWATIISVLLIFPRLIFDVIIHYKNKINPGLLMILLGGIIYLLTTFLINSDFGGRLFHGEKLLDGSAETRIVVFDFYKYLNSWDLLLGNPLNEQILKVKLNAAGIENGLIALIIKFGMVFTIYFIFILLKMYYYLLKRYQKLDRIFLLVTFFLVGFSNPNLVISIQYIIFLFSYYSFRSLENRRFDFN
jgi:hypothetical protein